MERPERVAGIGAVAAHDRAIELVDGVERLDLAGVGRVGRIGLVVAQRPEAILVNRLYNQQGTSLGGDAAVEKWFEVVRVFQGALIGRVHGGLACIAQAPCGQPEGVVGINVEVMDIAGAQAR